MVGGRNQRTIETHPWVLSFGGPCGRAPDHDGNDAFVAMGVADHILGLQIGHWSQPNGGTGQIERVKTGLHLGPIRATRVGQHLQLSLHAPTQTRGNCKQALHRRGEAQSKQDATLGHSKSSAATGVNPAGWLVKHIGRLGDALE